MSTPTLILGNNKWAIEEDSILGYAVEDRNGSYLPREISFTRGSDATFTTSTGVIRQACWNLIGYSEEFDNAYWTKTAASISSNVTTAPNGTLTADKLVENTANFSHQILSTSATVIVGANYVSSIYAKAGERNWVLVIYYDGSTPKGRYFDLTNGVGGAYWAGATITNSITSVGNGWYRITLSYSATTTSNILGVYLANGDNSNSYTGNGTSGLFIWGAQLVQGSDALGYLRTTDRLNMPRVDSSTGTKAFLLEPQRTNLVPNSNTFSSWIKAGVTSSITANSGISPDGTNNAWYFSAISGVKNLRQDIALIGGTVYTITLYVKSYGVGNNTFRLGDGGSASTLTTITATSTWQRATYTFTCASTGTRSVGIFQDASESAIDILIYGAQFEAGAYQTTYIPTQATTVTRIADSASKTGISSLIGQTEGTIYLDFVFKTSDSSVGGQIGISDSARTNRVVLWNNSTFNTLALQLKANNVNAINNVSLGTFVSGTRYKIAIAYKSGSTAVYVNGTQTLIDSASFTFSGSLTDFILGSYETTLNVGHQLCFDTKLFVERLTNAELAALTTL